jgi:carboxypeptidase T
MKRLFLLLSFFFCATLFSQTEKYHRVKIETGKDGLNLLAARGVSIDHGESKIGQSFIGEFSESDVDLIKKCGLPYTILISDMASYYQNRNLENAKAASASGNCKGCPTYLTPANFTLGSMGGFYTYPELMNILDSMIAKYPNIISVKQVIDTAHTFEGRQIYYVKISDNPNMAESEPQMLYTSLHHAREPESLTQLIFYMWHLLENYNTDPEVKYLVDNLEMYFIPCVNPDGYIYNHTTNPTGGGMWRKNRRDNLDGTFGVDLNRNYGYNWGFDNIGSSPTTSADNYRGPSAFSEKETQMMQNFCNKHTFQLAVNNHTYMNVLVQPYGYSGTAYTPDSLLYTDFGMRLTYCDGFTYGSALQTVGYVANGVSDDWMYGEQVSKPKILAMTPEAGSVDDGFWPVTANIIPIAENTLNQNIYAARLVATYAEVKDVNGPFIQQNGYIVYNIERLGLQPGTFSVSVSGLGGNFQTIGSGNSHAGMTELQSLKDSISFSLINGLTPGTVVKFLLNVNNGSYTSTDTITRVYGTPITVFTDNCSNLSQWTGTWGNSTTQFVSPAKSITDSPVGTYATGSNTKTTTISNISLAGAVAAYLEYYAQWQIEKNYDYAEIQISTNNGTTFSPLCARYTHNGNSNQDNLKPLYDGFQRVWVKERIDLAPYLGQSIKLRFNMVADGGVEYDGFYFDDITVKVINPSIGIANQTSLENNLQLYPNPTTGKFVLALNDNTSGPVKISVSNLLGEIIFSAERTNLEKLYEIDLSAVSNGTYFVHVQTSAKNYTQKVVVGK